MNNSKWYSRKKIKPMGYYDKGKKQYYNADSNKWVSRISIKDIKGEYKRLEFYEYDDRAIKSDFGYANIDRVGKLLDILFKRGRAREGKGLDFWIYIEAKELNQLLGEHYREGILNHLIENDIIESKLLGKSQYDANKELKVYKISNRLIDGKRREVNITHTKVKKFSNKSFERIKAIDKEGFIQYEIKTVKSITLKNIDMNQLILDRIEDKQFIDNLRIDFDYITNAEKKEILTKWDIPYINKYKKDFINDYKLLNDNIDSVKRNDIDTDLFSFDDYGKKQVVEKYGARLYNIITSKQKEFRKAIQIDKDDIAEVDMKNGYVSMFYRLCNILVNPVYKSNSIRKLLKGITNKDVFDFLEDYQVVFSNTSEVDFYFHAGVKVNKMTLLGGNKSQNRLYMKGLVLWLLNSHIEYGNDRLYVDEQFTKDELGERIFTKGGWDFIKEVKTLVIPQFEGIYGNIRDLESPSHYTFKNLNLLLNKMEVGIMQNIFRELIKRDIPYLSIFDGVIVKQSNVKAVKNAINTALYDIDDTISFKVKNI
jgi:hypothetical protein